MGEKLSVLIENMDNKWVLRLVWLYIFFFKFLVVGMDVRSMNEVCDLTALYIFFSSYSYYKRIIFVKSGGISMILEFSVILYL